ncbi:hypothetical protein BOTBODRAFT_173524 [Botryobasidium botryosum FD-172 SS1]|uniref:Peptidase S9 prolyl oligopeptidase catalytic domain-containing protein n=1 Tax=Botryobasidium botryosum (strain FD-172 SS1) TaxID=930990 RepID=A0A067MK07_BOTB1|nr:hypothetical protein BOTBODRAFT_173524 [Botryobasidium botryosum FD-172 SS1]
MADSDAITKTSLLVGGLKVQVFGASGESELPVAALFIIHGRLGSAAAVEGFAISILNHAKERQANGEEAARDLIVVTLDHRNHGSRLIDEKANKGWRDGNERHAVDMYTVLDGTARDVSFLIDFLPAYLYPLDEREIVEWAVAGVSLGGHSAWVLLKDEPRVKIGIPIIGCPDLLALMTQRAERNSLKLVPPYLPNSLRTYISKHGPAGAPFASKGPNNPFLNKSILVLSGAEDRVVPWTCSEDFVKRLEVGERGEKKVIVQAGVGHKLTPEMSIEAAKFIWRRALAKV